MDTLNLVQLLGEKLMIELPPVGLTFTSDPPKDVPVLHRDPQSFCTLWRWAEERVFYASGAQHMECGLGGLVSGFLTPDGREDELASLLDEMCEGGAGTADEIAQTATFQHGAAGAIYGPLWMMPVEPDMALMWATLPQMGVLQEVAGTIMWRNNPQGAVFPRPACAVLPIASANDKPALSLGCVGMREYTNVPPHMYLIALPGSHLESLEQAMQERDDLPQRLEFFQKRMAGGG
ncbi:MAG: DUF169 domain-containing protein [Chloroflexi bacterium]|nr:DUF169 domain-containing protein [Chloroflexota bacterium]